MKSKTKKISIIIPMFNSELTISRTLDSILCQNIADYEIIIVNDGSTDNSKKIVESYAKKNDEIVLLNTDNIGPSHARNIGMKKSTGKYIMFIDSDDTIEPKTFSKMSQYMDDYDLIVSGFSRIINGKKIDYIPKTNSDLSTEDFLIQNYMFWSPCFKLIKKSCIKFDFDESLVISEDLKFWVNNARFFKKYKYIETSTYNYFMNYSSSTASKVYGAKESNSLDAMIALTSESTSGLYIKQYFLDNYFEYKYRILNSKVLKEYDFYQKKYQPIAKKYYKNIRKSKLSFKVKIKNFIKYRMFALYKIIKNHK